LKTAQIRSSAGVRLLVALDDSGAAWDVSAALASRGSYTGLVGAIACARHSGVPFDVLLAELATESSETVAVDLENGRYSAESTWLPLAAPLDPPEVWAAGVTYRSSREARSEETGGKIDFYDKVYEAERPELFLKDSASRRTSGPHTRIGVRGDSLATVPEPEFALVLDADATVVGITLGNDVTARDIEAQNPLYLPQAKIFTAACAIGPVVTVFDSKVALDDEFDISLTIHTAGGERRFEGSTSTRQLNRSFAELAGYLSRYNVIEDGTVLMTGTGIVPPLDLGLCDGDEVIIASAALGVLTNTAVDVQTNGRMTPRAAEEPAMNMLDDAWDEYVRLVGQEQARNDAFPSEYPHYSEDGRWRRLRIDATSGWVDDAFYDHGNWTAGFAAGQAWLAHLGEADRAHVGRSQARTLDDVAFRSSDKTTHDLGFLFHPSFVMGEHLGFLSAEDLGPAAEAARALAERFNERGGYLQAFGPIGDARSRATSTIDTMMNLPLLWWAARATGDDEFRRRAMTHATSSAANFFRPDGSTYHLIRYDPDTGTVVAKGTFQGASDDSCWSRGQAWAIAGFAWSYAETGVEEFRAAALRAWDYFAPRIPADGVVPYDFGASDDNTEDASASAVAALGALILADTSEEPQQERVLREAATSILRRLHENAVRHDNVGEGILLRSCYSKPHGQGLSGALPYGDYYYGLAVALATGKLALPQILERDPRQESANRATDGTTSDRSVVP
jgi:2-keto-4-pentenoate hydratase/2-oxohepta-3-ene-1,7-dioic acid hydratase in catechol pathway